MVTIPNGDLSHMEIENFQHRDRFRFHPKIGLRYETTPDQIRYLLVELRSLLYRHPGVISEDARVRFLGLAADSLIIEFLAYVNAPDWSGFLEVQEDLNLRIMDIVRESGTGFAFPSQTIYLSRDDAPDSRKAEETAATVDKWRDDGALALPRFADSQVDELESTLDWPPRGSVLRREPELQPELPISSSRSTKRRFFSRKNRHRKTPGTD